MTRNEAIKAYIKKFGGFPCALFADASDELLIDAIIYALKTGKEIKMLDKDVLY